jgi:hypothetical protein
MKRSFVVALVVSGFVFAGTARAEDPTTSTASEEDPAATNDDSSSDRSEATDTNEPTETLPPQTTPKVDEPVAPKVDKKVDSGKTGNGKKKKNKARMSSTIRRDTRERIHDDGEGRLEKQEDTVLDGKHFRIKTAQGAIHVWVPDGYDRETAGTVVYIHGYWTDSDGAWKDHQLAKQFKKSHQNALFIVPDAPSSNEMGVQWPALTDLRKAITRANIKMPDGPIVVMGHSGAYRTAMQWVDHRLVDQIILLDAMYSGEQQFDEFIKSGKRADEHKMIVVGASTAGNSSAFVNKYKFSVGREGFPDSLGEFTKAERRAKLLYVHSQFDHYGIVTSQKVIPLLLRVTRLKSL